MESFLSLIATAVLTLLGAALGYRAGIREASSLRRMLAEMQRIYDERSQRNDAIFESFHDERERLLHQLVSMRKMGFVPIEEYSDPEEGDGDSWVLTNEHEAEVSDQRNHEGVSSLDRARLAEAVMNGAKAPPPLR